VDEKATEVLRPTTFVDPSKIRDAEAACQKCSGKVTCLL
jgi:hypothetical protein